METILTTTNLRRVFTTRNGKNKKEVVAVKGIDLEVYKGSIFGFLGPNGAGKTTTLQMLTTLLKPTSGKAEVVGFDLSKDQKKIRENIGYVSQAGGADRTANAIYNLYLQARLYGLDKENTNTRIKKLVKQVELTEFADRKVSSYSGGQRRRLDLALGMIHEPKLLFLDEPTTGLDPQSRVHFWEEIKEIQEHGTTIFLTTHYLDEADSLCDYIAIIDHGEIVAQGTQNELKKEAGGESIIIDLENDAVITKAEEVLHEREFVKNHVRDMNKLYLYVDDAQKQLAEVMRILDKNKLNIQSVELSKPSLDDVFLQQTGRSLREGGES